MKHFRSLLSLGAIEEDENMDHVELNRIKSLQTSISTRLSQQRKRQSTLQRLSFIDGNKVKLVNLPQLHHSYSTKQAYVRHKFFYPNNKTQKQSNNGKPVPDLSVQTSQHSENSANTPNSSQTGHEVVLGLHEQRSNSCDVSLVLFEQRSNSCDVSLHLETVESPHINLDFHDVVSFDAAAVESTGSDLDRHPFDVQLSHPEMETPVPSDLPAAFDDFDSAQSAFQQCATSAALRGVHSAPLPLPRPAFKVRQIHRHKYRQQQQQQQQARPKLHTHLPMPYVPTTSSSPLSPGDPLVCSSYKAQRERAIQSLGFASASPLPASPPLPAPHRPPPHRPPPRHSAPPPSRQRIVASVMDASGFSDWLPTPCYPPHSHSQSHTQAVVMVAANDDEKDDGDADDSNTSTYALRHLQHISMMHHLKSTSPAAMTPLQQQQQQQQQPAHYAQLSNDTRSRSNTGGSCSMYLRPENSITSIRSSVTSEALPPRISIHSYPSRGEQSVLSPIIARHSSIGSGCLSPIMSSPPCSHRPSVAPIPGSQRVHSPHLDHIISNVSELTDDDDEFDDDDDETQVIDEDHDAIWHTPSPVVFDNMHGGDCKMEFEEEAIMSGVMARPRLQTIESIASSINASTPRINPTLDANVSKEISFRYKKLVHPLQLQQQQQSSADDGMSSKRTSRTVTTNMTAASTRTSTTLSLPGDVYHNYDSLNEDSPRSLHSAIEEEHEHQPQLNQIDMVHALQHRHTMDIVSDSDDSEPERVEELSHSQQQQQQQHNHDINVPFEYQSDMDDHSPPVDDDDDEDEDDAVAHMNALSLQSMSRQSHHVYIGAFVVDEDGDDDDDAAAATPFTALQSRFHVHGDAVADDDGMVLVNDIADEDDNFLLMQPVALQPTSNSNDLKTGRLVEKRESNGSQILYELQSVHSTNSDTNANSNSKTNASTNTNSNSNTNTKQQQKMQKNKKEKEEKEEKEKDGIVLDDGFSLFGDKAHRFPVSDFETMGNVGRGAYGVVEKSFHLQSCQIVAVKRSRSPKQEMMNSFKREILICNTFAQCPFVVNMVNHGLDKKCNEYCIALEYFNKGSLASKASFSVLEVQHISFCILSALQALHAQLYVHNDIKPDNILWNSDGDVVLSDFGCVKQMKDADTPLSTSCGSFAFQSYEKKFLSPIQYTTKSDIYSFGITIAEMLNETHGHGTHGTTASSPQRSEEEELVPYKLPHGVVSKFEEHRDLLDFLAKCLDKNYQTRWSAAQLLSHPFITHDYNYERSKLLFAKDNGGALNENEDDLLFMTDTLIDYYLSYNKTRDDAVATNEVDGTYFEDRSKTPIDGHVPDPVRLRNMAKYSGFASDAVLDFISKSVNDVKNRYLKL